MIGLKSNQVPQQFTKLAKTNIFQQFTKKLANIRLWKSISKSRYSAIHEKLLHWPKSGFTAYYEKITENVMQSFHHNQAFSLQIWRKLLFGLVIIGQKGPLHPLQRQRLGEVKAQEICTNVWPWTSCRWVEWMDWMDTL